MSSAAAKADPLLARKAREALLKRLGEAVLLSAQQSEKKLQSAYETSKNAREQQDRGDRLNAYKKGQRAWVEGTAKKWRETFSQAKQATNSAPKSLGMALELENADSVQGKIYSSRLAMAISEKVTWDLNHVKLRVQFLEGTQELASNDLLRPETYCQALVESWFEAGMDADTWQAVQDVIAPNLVKAAEEGYSQINASLVAAGVMPEIDLRGLVKRAPTGSAGGAAAMAARTGHGHTAAGTLSAASTDWANQTNAYMVIGPDGSMGVAVPGGPMAAGTYPGGAVGNVAGGYGGGVAGGYGGGVAGVTVVGAGGVAGASGGVGPGAMVVSPGAAVAGAGGGFVGGGPAYAGPPLTPAQRAQMLAEETRMLTAATPLARVRMRSEGLMGQFRRFIVGQIADFGQAVVAVAGGGAGAAAARAAGVNAAGAVLPPGAQIMTPQLAQALAYQPTLVVPYDVALANAPHAPQQAVERAAKAAKEQTADLKEKAETQKEKATIEIVALMFQSILAEDRLPAAMRIWFARLQVPVLRVALADPEFFEKLDHPVRKLIDRMGSVVLGFDGASLGGSSELENEVKRVVQTIEQYPETGRRVFELVLGEFEKFLEKFLKERGISAKQLVSVAQQVEQREALAIQYTIEMRNQLTHVPVTEEVRDFLLKTWCEVLALASIRYGAKDVKALDLKKVATDLVWAATPKPNRQDRARVIADLPNLLLRLRGGMALLGMAAEKQDEFLQSIKDALTKAFTSKADAIDRAAIDKLGAKLANLEEFFEDDDVGDLPLDESDIELMLGIDTSNIIVITDGGSRPSPAMMQWAKELQMGTWFQIDHNGKTSKVQYSWRSEKGHLSLFASESGMLFLVQAKRLAAYLQAGLLLPLEEETLTVRATREALTKLDANPERLFN